MTDKAFAAFGPSRSWDDDSCAIISWASTSVSFACDPWKSESSLFEISGNYYDEREVLLVDCRSMI